MKIVITGALGHIGSRTIREIPLAIQDAQILMIDNLSTNRYASLFNLPSSGQYRFVEADVLQMDIAEHLVDADAVIHLAAITDAASSFENRAQVENVNYHATERVAKACMKTATPLIHLSSTSVYGTQDEAVDENCSRDELQPQSPYAETKLKEEKFLQEEGKKGNLHFIICRFGTIAGVSTGMRFHTAVNKFCWQALMGQPLTVWTTALHQKRPYLDLSDAIRSFVFILQNQLFDNRIYNILTQNHTVNEIVQYIQNWIPQLSIQYIDSQIMNQLSYEVMNQRILDKGFYFKGSIEKCIKDTIELLRESVSL